MDGKRRIRQLTTGMHVFAAMWIAVMVSAFPGEEDSAVSGIPRSDGRKVVFTNRIGRRAALYDLRDVEKPRLMGAWKFSGNPDLAVFHGGKVIIPCGYQGVLMQK